MNIQFSIIEWIIVAIIWLASGMLIDVLKLLLAVFGNSASHATKTLKNISHDGKAGVLKIDPQKIEIAVVKDISKVFGAIKCSLLSWSTNFLRQVVKPQKKHEDANVSLNNNVHNNQKKDTSTGNLSYLVPCDNDVKSIFNNPENEYAGQQIIGALIGFISLIAFFYADAAQGAQTFRLLFPEGEIPPFLNEIILPLIVASAGSALILGIFVGDILGMTHLGLFSKDAPKLFIWIIGVNLVLTLSLSTFIALTRMQLLGTDSETVEFLVNVAQSIVILPMLVTTFLLFRGIYGIYVALSIFLSLLSVPFGVFEFFLRILVDLVLAGLVGGSFIITRIIWLAVGALELVFLLLEMLIKGSFSVITHLILVVFFVPNLIFRAVLRFLERDAFYDEFLKNITDIPLKTDIDNSLLRQSENLISENNQVKNDSDQVN